MSRMIRVVLMLAIFAISCVIGYKIAVLPADKYGFWKEDFFATGFFLVWGAFLMLSAIVQVSIGNAPFEEISPPHVRSRMVADRHWMSCIATILCMGGFALAIVFGVLESGVGFGNEGVRYLWAYFSCICFVRVIFYGWYANLMKRYWRPSPLWAQ